MRTGGKITATIEILDDFDSRRVPLKTAIADWGRNNRYAGAKDRAWISGLCLDCLRRKASLSAAVKDGSTRMRVLAALVLLWRMPIAELSGAVEDEHGPGALSDDERATLNAADLSAQTENDAPDWIAPLFERAFGAAAGAELAGLSARADIELRINALEATAEKAFPALKSVRAETVPATQMAARIAAPDPAVKAPAVTVIPAFNKGWVEVQDLGSQLAALAAGEIGGRQVLDYCAGGGGKTLALGARMNGTGQLYAFDIDARRLKPLYHRAKRAGLKNLQIRSPIDEAPLADLLGKMDVVFVDAPCTGSGTWRRHPDAKWRLTEKQLTKRIAEQDEVLRVAADFVKPGGRMVYVTCSVFVEENEDRIAAFLSENLTFRQSSALDEIASVDVDAATFLKAHVTDGGGLRLTPMRTGTDGFYVAVLRRDETARRNGDED